MDKLSISEELVHLVFSAASVVAHQWLVLIRIVVDHFILVTVVLIICHCHRVVFAALDVLHESPQVLALG